MLLVEIYIVFFQSSDDENHTKNLPTIVLDDQNDHLHVIMINNDECFYKHNMLLLLLQYNETSCCVDGWPGPLSYY